MPACLHPKITKLLVANRSEIAIRVFRAAGVFHHELPGGQYSNLRTQAAALGLLDHFEQTHPGAQLTNLLPSLKLVP